MDLYDQIIETNNQLHQLIGQFAENVSSLSVYKKEELGAKGELLHKLREVQQHLGATYQTVNNTVEEQCQTVEKYLSDEEARLNSLRKNLYQVDDSGSCENDNTDSESLGETPNPVSLVKVTPPPGFTHKPKKTPKTDTTWTKVVKKGRKPPPAPLPTRKVNREVAPGLFIPAFTINDPAECHQKLGHVCWSLRTERFCISINGEIITGNTTIIRPSGETPKKFIEHRRSENTDYRKSDYYVPYERNSNSRDIRQFTAKMRFVPASQELQKHEVYVYRIGSRDTLKQDILSVQAEDYRLFSDLTMNFLLCRITAAQEIRTRINNGIKQ